MVWYLTMTLTRRRPVLPFVALPKLFIKVPRAAFSVFPPFPTLLQKPKVDWGANICAHIDTCLTQQPLTYHLEYETLV